MRFTFNGKRVAARWTLAAFWTAVAISCGAPQAAALQAYLVRDIFPGESSSRPSALFAFGDSILFAADDGVSGAELWTSDGTEAGTVRVVDVNPTSTAGGGSSPTAFEILGNRAYFAAHDGVNGRELWSTDGTSASLVKNINATALFGGSSNPTSLTAFNGALYFRANDGTRGMELWRSDGSGPGTDIVSDFVPGPLSGGTTEMMVSGGVLYFSAADPTHGRELWRLTPAGEVELLRDILLGTTGGLPNALADIGGKLFFSASTLETGAELWTSDGTPDGTAIVKDIVPGTASGGAQQITDVGGVAFFRAHEPVAGSFQLWRSNGAEAGTALVADLYPGTGMAPDKLTSFNGTLFFIHANGQDFLSNDLWKSDGTTAGTERLALFPDAVQSVIGDLVPAGNRLFFSAATFDGVDWTHGLYATDGTAAGTESVFETGPFNEFSQEPNIFEMTWTGTHLFFRATRSIDADGFGIDEELFAVAVPEPTAAALAAGILAGAAGMRRGARRRSTALPRCTD